MLLIAMENNTNNNNNTDPPPRRFSINNISSWFSSTSLSSSTALTHSVPSNNNNSNANITNSSTITNRISTFIQSIRPSTTPIPFSLPATYYNRRYSSETSQRSLVGGTITTSSSVPTILPTTDVLYPPTSNPSSSSTTPTLKSKNDVIITTTSSTSAAAAAALIEDTSEDDAGSEQSSERDPPPFRPPKSTRAGPPLLPSPPPRFTSPSPLSPRNNNNSTADNSRKSIALNMFVKRLNSEKLASFLWNLTLCIEAAVDCTVTITTTTTTTTTTMNNTTNTPATIPNPSSPSKLFQPLTFINTELTNKFRINTVDPPTFSIDKYLGRICFYLNKYAQELNTDMSFNDDNFESGTGFLAILGSCNLIMSLTSEYGLQLNPHNVHRVLLTCILIAHKFIDDDPISNLLFAQIAGVPLPELCELEIELAKTLDFHFSISHTIITKTLPLIMSSGSWIMLMNNGNI
jgi:hypothetical protein